MYGLFINYVRLNKQNQAEIQDDIDNLYIMDMKWGVGATQLIGEILIENQIILRRNYDHIIYSIVDQLENSEEFSLKKSAWIYYLSHMMVANSEPNQHN